MDQTPPRTDHEPTDDTLPRIPVHPVVTVLDYPLVALLGLLMGIVYLLWKLNPLARSPDAPNAAGHEPIPVKILGSLLRWRPQQRVGCALAVAIGIAIGGAILWYGVR